MSIRGGSDHDYDTFRKLIMTNPRIHAYLQQKGWGIINELTSAVLSRTKGTGRHFHFGPDQWARQIYAAWMNNPNIPVQQYIGKRKS